MMWTSGRIITGIAAGMLLTMVNLGCAAKQPEIKDTWTAAAQQASSSASRAEAAAGRAEAAAAKTADAANQVANTAARIQAQMEKSMRK